MIFFCRFIESRHLSTKENKLPIPIYWGYLYKFLAYIYVVLSQHSNTNYYIRLSQ